jgi:hypothetical protein
MDRLFRRWLIMLLLVGAVGAVGCPGNEAKPNSDLKVPNVPPGGSASKMPPMKGPSSK